MCLKECKIIWPTVLCLWPRSQKKYCWFYGGFSLLGWSLTGLIDRHFIDPQEATTRKAQSHNNSMTKCTPVGNQQQDQPHCTINNILKDSCSNGVTFSCKNEPHGGIYHLHNHLTIDGCNSKETGKKKKTNYAR